MIRFSRSQILLTPWLIVLDILSLIAALALAYQLRFFSSLTTVFPAAGGIPDWHFYRLTLNLIIPLFVFILFQHGLYRVYFLNMIDELIRVARSVTVGMFFLMLATFFYREFSFSRLTFVIFWALAILIIVVYREIFKGIGKYVLFRFAGRENVLVIGFNNRKLKGVLKKNPHLQVCYAACEGEENIERIKELIQEKQIQQVIINNQQWNPNVLMSFYDWCENRRVDLKFVPDLVQLCKGEIKIDSSLGMPVFHLRSASFSGFNFYFKRILDILVSMTILSFIWPLIILVIVMVKIDSPGSYIYRHKRMGYRGNVFNFFKFRTMVSNADDLLEQVKKLSDRKGPVFKMTHDPRVTRIGSFLRRYSIDEILQLFNVLRGDMSLVGPRPQVLWEAASYDDWAKRRLRVLPGITGLWQVSGRANLSYEEMIALDIYYIENWSPGLDIAILFRTMSAIFGKDGAY